MTFLQGSHILSAAELQRLILLSGSFKSSQKKRVQHVHVIKRAPACKGFSNSMVYSLNIVFVLSLILSVAGIHRNLAMTYVIAQI